MNSRQRRYSARYWKHMVTLHEPTYVLLAKRAEWICKNFGRKNKGRRYCWCGIHSSQTTYQFHKEKDYLAFVMKWGLE